MDARSFRTLRSLIHQNSGIWLHDGKQALLCARVGKRMRALGLTGVTVCHQRLEAGPPATGPAAGIHDAALSRAVAVTEDLLEALRPWLRPGAFLVSTLPPHTADLVSAAGPAAPRLLLHAAPGAVAAAVPGAVVGRAGLWRV